MNSILTAALVLGGLGFVFGIGLTIATKIFHVPVDQQLIDVREALPGANCGGCGYPGCDACADAIFEGVAPIDSCPVGGKPLADKIALIMGVEQKAAIVKMTAKVRCQGSCSKTSNKFEYAGIRDCRAAALVSGGYKTCEYGCLGLGSCETACEFDALHINPETNLPEVDDEKCVACSACVNACPRHLIKLQPVNLPVRVLCMSFNKGKAVKEGCSIGCIGCTLCAKKCKFGAIQMVNNLPVINDELCVGCMECAKACPTKAIYANFEFANPEFMNNNI
ncbi:MAG: RnfABCDGE type electron transport complex subunit B [Eubacteriales bacterium]|nr:RnfABCDGE type electron transport complex subunit B [Eubacteriales bacterium]